jgi:hypothetical protein
LATIQIKSLRRKAQELSALSPRNWAATITLAGGTTNMMAGGEESKAA